MGRRPFPSSYHTLPPQNPEPSLFLGPRAIAGAPQQRSRGLPVRARESEARAAGASHTLINELLRVGTRP